MSDVPVEMVEKAAAALDDNTTYSKNARAALLAVGLPALLERVEVAEEETRQAIATGVAEVARAQAERDALAAKVPEGWKTGWLAAIDWLAEYGADRDTALLVDDMRTRISVTKGSEGA